jgi:hypothetical protein
MHEHDETANRNLPNNSAALLLLFEEQVCALITRAQVESLWGVITNGKESVKIPPGSQR